MEQALIEAEMRAAEANADRERLRHTVKDMQSKFDSSELRHNTEIEDIRSAMETEKSKHVASAMLAETRATKCMADLEARDATHERLGVWSCHQIVGGKAVASRVVYMAQVLR